MYNFSDKIFLDHNASTPLLAEVRECLESFLEVEHINPSARVGSKLREHIEHAREQVAELVGAKSDEVIFVSGATESCFQAIFGVCSSKKERKDFKILISPTEHLAVIESVKTVSQLLGIEFLFNPVDRNGLLDLEYLNHSLTKGIGLMSFMLANNETGVLNPIEEIVSIAKNKGILIHSDAVSAVAKCEVSMEKLGIDLLSLTAHKIGGPKGIGALIVKNGIKWESLMKAGGQQLGRRGGSESIALIVGFGKAASIAKKRISSNAIHTTSIIRDSFEEKLKTLIPNISINGVNAERICNTSNILIPGISAIKIVDQLAEEGLIISAGSACKTNSIEPSHVLKAMGLSSFDCLSSIRVSFGFESDLTIGERAAEKIFKVVTESRNHNERILREQQNISDILPST